MSDARALTREQLLHLVDRARRGSILAAELDDLHAGINATCDRVEFYEGATSRMRDRAEVATVRADRAEAEVTRLTAGQCLDSRCMCEQHHTPPVTGCPYPQCVTARQQQETDHA